MIRWTDTSGRVGEGKKEELEGLRGIHTYPALLLSSSQPLDWPGLGWALLSHWGRATQSHMPTEGREKEVRRGKLMEEERRKKRGRVERRQRRINLTE